MKTRIGLNDATLEKLEAQRLHRAFASAVLRCVGDLAAERDVSSYRAEVVAEARKTSPQER